MKTMYTLLVVLVFMITSVFATEVRVCPPCPYHPCPTDFITLIKKDLTISVPGVLPIAPFTQVDTIQDALDALENYKISKKATVTIQLTQNADNYDTINVTHPDGDKINIVGNCGGNTCIIQFKAGVSGVYVGNGNKLGYLNNLNLIGQQSAQTFGIYACEGGNILCGSNMTVQRFNDGIKAMNGSYIHAPNIKSEYNIGGGIVADRKSSVLVENAKVGYNNASGIYARAMSFIDASYAVSEHNMYGVVAHEDSYISAVNIQVTYNTNGVWLNERSVGKFDNGIISNNNNYGIHLGCDSDGFAWGTTITGNNPDTEIIQDSHLYR